MIFPLPHNSHLLVLPLPHITNPKVTFYGCDWLFDGGQLYRHRLVLTQFAFLLISIWEFW